ncbi:hypothetical protein CYMTET_15430 [Cymbomonas tetramitiformis]|uniref:Uncharacterized protein n=1 Tax=Cymbomonas tetramitiformis TaxID=36881 RepID=A0AAE0L9C7_9CHLO|nr:hypothetical protein CYMTET_15430 [Cymbomonas tetramitiformis]
MSEPGWKEFHQSLKVGRLGPKINKKKKGKKNAVVAASEVAKPVGDGDRSSKSVEGPVSKASSTPRDKYSASVELAKMWEATQSMQKPSQQRTTEDNDAPVGVQTHHFWK